MKIITPHYKLHTYKHNELNAFLKHFNAKKTIEYQEEEDEMWQEFLDILKTEFPKRFIIINTENIYTVFIFDKNKAVKIIFAAPTNALEGPKLTYFFVSNMNPSNV